MTAGNLINLINAPDMVETWRGRVVIYSAGGCGVAVLLAAAAVVAERDDLKALLEAEAAKHDLAEKEN